MYYDHLPPLSVKKYLKPMYCYPACAGKFDTGDINTEDKL
jgi:hypothetical protein